MTNKVKALEDEIKVLELELQKAKLKLEIEKVSKTKVEETIVERRIIYRDAYHPPYPWWNQPSVTWYGATASGTGSGISTGFVAGSNSLGNNHITLC